MVPSHYATRRLWEVNLSKPRIAGLRAMIGAVANLSKRGEIVATAHESSLTEAIAAVLNAALAVSHLEFKWQPRELSETFTAEVGDILLRSLWSRVTKNVSILGASGDHIEIPFAIRSQRFETYVQPVAYGDGRVDGNDVYRGFEKMMESPNVGAEDAQRIIVVDNSEAQEDLARSVTFLGACANVVRFNRLEEWIVEIAA